MTRTTTILLDGLHDPADSTSWETFDRRYRPVIIALSRRMGLAEADAADVAQETITRFILEYREGRYDRSRGRLRNWLLALSRTRIAEHYRKGARARIDGGESHVREMPDEATMTQLWEQERRTVLLRSALEELRSSTKTDERTIEAFELLVAQRMPALAVAERLEMKIEDVYLAKSRVAARLRTIVHRLEAACEGE
ncbi:MAG: RNA polymerase sigma factor [Planctomycetota bacterium]|jgi:RNA polymerase sigma-70 factor (ECF subfamily)